MPQPSFSSQRTLERHQPLLWNSAAYKDSKIAIRLQAGEMSALNGNGEVREKSKQTGKRADADGVQQLRSI
jgi:hypothetical protein